MNWLDVAHMSLKADSIICIDGSHQQTVHSWPKSKTKKKKVEKIY